MGMGSGCPHDAGGTPALLRRVVEGDK